MRGDVVVRAVGSVEVHELISQFFSAFGPKNGVCPSGVPGPHVARLQSAKDGGLVGWVFGLSSNALHAAANRATISASSRLALSNLSNAS